MAATGEPASFRFVGLELPWVLGPADGRYVLRGHAGEAAHVLILETVSAPVRPRRRRGRRVAPEPAPASVSTTRATIVHATAVPGGAAAATWLARADLRAEAQRAVAILNDVLHAERVVRADPFLREVTLEQALAARVGVGRGEEVAAGRWTDARRVDPTPAPGALAARRDAQRRRARLAALLAGRDVLLACEELTLRARLDVDRERWREAALQLRVALDAALAELPAWAHHADIAARVEELDRARAPTLAAAQSALEGGLDDARSADVAHVLGRLEAALAARIAHGLE